jgi:hypothetical protein
MREREREVSDTRLYSLSLSPLSLSPGYSLNQKSSFAPQYSLEGSNRREKEKKAFDRIRDGI